MKSKKAAAIMLCAVLGTSMITGVSVSAKDKDELVLYTWDGMFPQEVLDDFEKETGTKVVYSNFDTDETMLEKLSQAKGGDYDVVIADDYIIDSAVKEGLVQKIDKDTVSNFKNINPLYQGQFYDPDDEYTVPYGAGIPLIVYDPEQVDIDIKGYKDLWDKSLEDSIAIVGNYRVICGITQLSMGESMNEEDVAVIDKTGEKLKELAPNIRMIQDDNTQNALLNGEASVAFLYTSQVTQALKDNPDLKVVYPEEGLGFGIMGMFVPSEAPNAKAANEFINYILEPEVSAQCINYIGYYNTNKAADDLVIPSQNEIGSLTTSFNVMTHKIEDLMAQNVHEQELKRKSELKALQSQINPHFLYNTLDSIIWMAEGKKNEEVVIMTASLARLLRQSISNEDELVTVGQEIEYVRSYLTIQKMRYKDKLEFEIKADPSITQVPIIRLVLQPLVENAIYHGLKYKDSKGLLTVHGYMKGENAVIDITDDGVGMDEETLKHIYDKHKVNYRSNGVGVYNVQQRLVLYYGKDYGIIYHSEKGKGTTASVVIPGIQEESHEKS